MRADHDGQIQLDGMQLRLSGSLGNPQSQTAAKTESETRARTALSRMEMNSPQICIIRYEGNFGVSLEEREETLLR